jgi:hypothetical protein
MSPDNTNQDNTDGLEVEQAKVLAGLLENHAQRLSMRTLKKLEDGRLRAVEMHQKSHGASVNRDGTLNHWVAWVDHHRIAFASLVLVAIISSFIVFQNLNSNETSDAFLLGADLPPEAFVDKGFEPLLNKRANI